MLLGYVAAALAQCRSAVVMAADVSVAKVVFSCLFWP